MAQSRPAAARLRVKRGKPHAWQPAVQLLATSLPLLLIFAALPLLARSRCSGHDLLSWQRCWSRLLPTVPSRLEFQRLLTREASGRGRIARVRRRGSSKLPVAGDPSGTSASKAASASGATSAWSTTGFVHSLDDKELFARAVSVQKGSQEREGEARRIAFLFLTRGPLPLAPFWDRFFSGHEDLFSIYIHATPGFTFQRGDVPERFQDRLIPSKEVRWGEMSVVDAERRLVASAMLDSSNARFVLISESCIPLYNFTFIHSYLMGTQRSFIKGVVLPGITGAGRWHTGFLPLVPRERWRKGSQWVVLTWHMAKLIVADKAYYEAFLSQCAASAQHHCCCQDEHYIQTMAHAQAPKLIENRTLTWVNWSDRTNLVGTFRGDDIWEHIIPMLRGPNGCRYNDEYHAPCFLFARKFGPDTVGPLLNITASFGF